MDAVIEIKDVAGFVIGEITIRNGEAMIKGPTAQIKEVLSFIPKSLVPE